MRRSERDTEESPAIATEEELFDPNSLCGVPTDYLDQMQMAMTGDNIPRFRRLRRQLTEWSRKAKNRMQELSAAARSVDDPERWARLRRSLSRIEASGDSPDDKRRQKVAAVVSAIDLVLFAKSLEAGMHMNKADAHKIVAQMAGLLQQEQVAPQQPVFTWNVIALPGPSDPKQEEDFARQLRAAAQTAAVLDRPAE